MPLLLLFLFLATVLSSSAAPLQNGDFTQPAASGTDPGWRFVTPLFGSNVGGNIDTGAGVANLGGPSPVISGIVGLRMQLQANSAINAISPGAATLLNANDLVGNLGRGSFLFQTFDTLSGNAGNVIEYTYSASTTGLGQAFAYFFEIDNQIETFVSLPTGANLSGSFNFGNNTNMLVGFGVLAPVGSSATLNLQQVNQVPEIDAGSAALPICIMILLGFLITDRRRGLEAA